MDKLYHKRWLTPFLTLQLNGFETVQSNQGNNSISPWIQFHAPTPNDLYEGEHELKMQIMSRYGINPDVINEHSPTFNREKQVEIEEEAREQLAKDNVKYTAEFNEWSERTCKMAEDLQAVVGAFYDETPPEENAPQLGVVFPYRSAQYAPYIQDIPFLQAVFNDLKDTEDMTEDERRELSAKALEEMRRFTVYMKNRFFESK